MSWATWAGRWRAAARRLRREALTLWLAARHPGTPWHARLLAGVLVAYAFSPIDLIPDVIPVLGLVDELVLLPLGVLLVRRWIPEIVLAECRAQAETLTARPVSRLGAVAVITAWLALAGVGIWLLGRW